MGLEENNNSSDIAKENKKEELKKIREEVADCFLCPLSKSRTNTVPGEGSFNSEIMFIGEGPGANEDMKGVPFCGAAGSFLDTMLSEIGLDRNDVFVTNTVKCRPPGNRDPEDSEKQACRPYLERQIKLIKPLLIVCLGKHAMLSIVPGAGNITQMHGKALKRPSGQVYLPLYHPAAALHNGGLRQTLVDDFKKIPKVIEKIKETNKNDSNKNNKPVQQKLI